MINHYTLHEQSVGIVQLLQYNECGTMYGEVAEWRGLERMDNDKTGGRERLWRVNRQTFTMGDIVLVE